MDSWHWQNLWLKILLAVSITVLIVSLGLIAWKVFEANEIKYDAAQYNVIL